VLKAPKRGLGRAYIDGLPFVRGKYMILGDCDCTYDFRELKPFMEKFHEGYAYIMGSRFAGYIEDGAMPPLHRYLGTPVTTWILNRIYSSRFSDIHCGMRGITKEAFQNMTLSSQSWEYASEMVLKSVHFELKTAEVPIRFLKDRDGRLSHHKRSGWLSPWKAAWINLRAMFVYGPSFFLFRPGLILLVLGLLLMFPLVRGPVRVGPITLSLHWMLLGLCLSVTGLQSVYMGILGQVIMDYKGRKTESWENQFPYDRAVFASVVLLLLGLALAVPLVIRYWKGGLALPVLLGPVNYLAVAGIFFVISGFMTFTFVLLLNAVEVRQKEWRATLNVKK
jgi:glycosyltransferase involved in cell wall biosynthesis